MADRETEATAGYLIKRVQQSLRRRCDAALRPTGLSMAQYAVLRALADHPEASAAELARLCFVTRQSLQDLLAVLRTAGLITDADTHRPGRARSLGVTAEGAHRLAAAHDAVTAVDASMTDGMSAAARRQLVASLLRCAENLERVPGTDGIASSGNSAHTAKAAG
ncbi:MarR family transcriptional regulator [Mycolicibacterium rufum]|uniref:MarR family transcriptional regulator n=1 Tax=Mycolicibacterium rufum TaxID=318424 RepID=A0A9X2Y8V2_9MYCO|nr:MarR family transcriptional regulator [Mycolicibacterium rufum]KGI67663.1 MarR family transcriptional regulator [Mycolicibacterium rufum]MCV7069404.1 MarR family transcriptional regulator [Mycolicibacterium rufum]ULP38636.1 MarR family transcriptional regulator [Mycolicibacterium rufum]